MKSDRHYSQQRRTSASHAIPPLTEERRKQLVKQVHHHVEDAKVSARNIRRDAMAQVRELMSEKMISEDDERRRGPAGRDNQALRRRSG